MNAECQEFYYGADCVQMQSALLSINLYVLQGGCFYMLCLRVFKAKSVSVKII